MSKKYIFIVIGLLVLAAAAFGIYRGLNKSKQSVVAGIAERQKVAAVIPVWLKTNKDVLKIQDELDTLADYRAEYGCLTNAPSNVPQCEHYNQRFDQQFSVLQDTVHRLQIENKSPKVIATAVANIKNLREDQTLQVQLMDILDNPYSDNGKNVDLYQDNKGLEYMVDAATNQVVQFVQKAGGNATFKQTPRLSVAQLKQKATDYLSKHISDFNIVNADYTYSEATKDNSSYAFRWDSKTKPLGADMSPFVQAVLSPAGDIMGFNDIRSLYNK